MASCSSMPRLTTLPPTPIGIATTMTERISGHTLPIPLPKQMKPHRFLTLTSGPHMTSCMMPERPMPEPDSISGIAEIRAATSMLIPTFMRWVICSAYRITTITLANIPRRPHSACKTITSEDMILIALWLLGGLTHMFLRKAAP